MAVPRAVPAALLALGLAAAEASAHGGSYRAPPGKGAPGGIPTDSEILDPKVPVPTPPDRSTLTPWERWWDVNRDRVLDLRKRIRARDRRDAPTVAGDDGDPFFADAAKPPAGPDLAVTREFLEREVLPVVTRALGDADGEVRSAAALALGKMGFARSFLDLRKVLGDRERDVREAALLALGMTGEAMAAEHLGPLLLDPRTEERMRAVAALSLGLLGGAAGAEGLLAYLDPESDARFQGGIRRRASTECTVLAALALARHGPALPRIREVALSPRDTDGSKADPTVRSFALAALAKAAGRGESPSAEFRRFLAEDREVLRQGAALALGLGAEAEDAASLKALEMAALGDRDATVRALSLMALARIGGDGAKRVVRASLAKSSPLDLPFAGLAAGILGDPEAIPLVRERFLARREPDLRGALATALALLGDREALPALREEVSGKGDRRLRRHCLIALGILGDAPSAPVLKKILAEERDPWLKTAAGTALGLLGDAETVPLLVAHAKGASSVLARGHACRVLGLVGNREAAKALIALAKDPKEQGFVRMFAVGALGTLGERGDHPLLAAPSMDANPEVRVDALDAAADLL
jgi:HEAT repeat protein